jgi:hypothetical protein
MEKYVEEQYLWYPLKNPYRENRRYDIQYVLNITFKNPDGENRRYDIYSCIDIASLKPLWETILRKNSYMEKEYNMMFEYVIT